MCQVVILYMLTITVDFVIIKSIASITGTGVGPIDIVTVLLTLIHTKCTLIYIC